MRFKRLIRYRRYILLGLFGCLLVFVFQSSLIADSKNESTKTDRYKNLELFQKVVHLVETKYVDSVENQKLIYGAIKGMIETLDPHSSFLTPEMLREMKNDTSGKFGGVGIEISMKNGVLSVISPIEGTPAWKAGLKPNDRIVKIAGESTKGMGLEEAVRKMRGKKGTPIRLSIYRKGLDKLKDITLYRDEIKIQVVKSEELEEGFGYIRLSSFNENAGPDVRKALQQLEKKHKIKGMILDLRMNPGGLLDQAVEVASQFLDGVPVVITKDRTGVVDTKVAKMSVAFKDFPMAVLVNSSSASAAEIVAGALQDHKRAIIMGQSTFGKGSVQQVVELGSDLGLKLTIQRYYTPSGRSIQEKGVQPDILLEDYDQKVLAEARRKNLFLREKDLKGHMPNPDDADDHDSGTIAQDVDEENADTLANNPSSKTTDKSTEEDWTPVKFDPKKDYQVQMALKYIKSYDVFKKLVFEGAPGQSEAPATASK